MSNSGIIAVAEKLVKQRNEQIKETIFMEWLMGIAIFLGGAAAGGMGVRLLLLARMQARGEKEKSELAIRCSTAETRLENAEKELELHRQKENESAGLLRRLAVSETRCEQIPALEQLLRRRDETVAGLEEELRGTAAELAAVIESNKKTEELQEKLEKSELQKEKQTEEILRLSGSEQNLLATLQQERRTSGEKLALLTEAREALQNQFKVLADEILEEKSKRFSQYSRENLGGMLQPLHERIEHFDKLVRETYDKESKQRFSLEQELKRLQEMNGRLNRDALALTDALTGASSKAQGTWGEMVLEKVLEASGLTKGREYLVQVSDTLETEEEGRKRYQPDVIIHLPEGKQLVVDSKVSLNAYVRYASLTDEAQKNRELKSHIAAIRQHIHTLSEKRYQDLCTLNTLDFVFMFIPVEPAYLLAVQHDAELFQESFRHKIMIVGPSNLLATLRTVAGIWRSERQNSNAREIARQSGKMYDKFVGFAETLEKLGLQIEQTRNSYQRALGQLKSGPGNLIRRAENLREMGVRHHRELPSSLAPEKETSDSEDEEDAAAPGRMITASSGNAG